MLTLFAKNIAGDMIPLSVPSEPHRTWNAIHPLLASIVCPEDPSRLILLPPYTNRGDREEDDGSDEDREDCEEDDGSDEDDGSYEYREEPIPNQWGIFCVWKEGDILSFLVKEAVPFCIHFLLSHDTLYDYMDNAQTTPYHAIEIYVESEFASSASKNLYRYIFLYAPRQNTFIRPSEYSFVSDNQDTFLSIARGAVSWTDLYQMIQTDATIPSRFRERIFRSIHRKWSRSLREMARLPRMEIRRRFHLTSTYEKRKEEARIVKGFHRLFRQIPPPYPRLLN